LKKIKKTPTILSTRESEGENTNHFVYYTSIAKGSCGETRSQLYRVYDRKYISQEKFEETKENTIILSKKMSSFIRYLNNSDFDGTKYRK